MGGLKPIVKVSFFDRNSTLLQIFPFVGPKMNCFREFFGNDNHLLLDLQIHNIID